MEFTVHPKAVFRVMLWIITVLTSMHVAQLYVYYYVGDPSEFDFIEALDFDYEGNLPSLYSHMAIFFSALLLWLVAWHKRIESADYRYHWLVLAIIMTFLGMDEAMALHEELGDIFEENEWVDASGFLYFAWVFPYAILLTIFLFSYLKFVFSLPREITVLFIAAGTLFVSGAIGIEVFSAREAEENGTLTVLYSFLYTVEEICEMCGIAIFCYALLRYIEIEHGAIRMGISSD